MYEDELMHYGRRGMKWYQHIYGKEQGHAKYANADKLEAVVLKDGRPVSLTPYGRKVLSKIRASDKKYFDWSNNKAVESAVVKKGVKHLSNDTDLIKGGTRLRRYSNVKEELSDKRAYMSLTPRDSFIYKEDAKYGNLGFEKPTDKFYRMTVKTRKDMLVATGSSVLDYVRKNYDSEALEKAYEKVKKFKPMDIYDQAQWYMQNGENLAERQVGGFVLDVASGLADEINKVTYRNPNAQKEIIDHFSSLGYSAMVDIEDRLYGYQYPLITFNPKRDLRVEKYDTIKVKPELSHSGVKGMEWYVRRFQPYTQVPTRSGKIGKFIGSYVDSSLDHRVKELEEQAVKSWNRYKELRAKYGKNDERVKNAKEDACRDGAFYGVMNKRLNVDKEQKTEIGRMVLASINQNEAVTS